MIPVGMKTLGLCLLSAGAWFLAWGVFNYKTEGIMVPLVRSGAVSLDAVALQAGRILLVQLLAGLALPFALRRARGLLRRKTDSPERAVIRDGASALLSGLALSAPALILCAAFAGREPAAGVLALTWGLTAAASGTAAAALLALVTREWPASPGR